MQNPYKTNQALLEAFRLGASGLNNITEATIELKGGHIPTITLKRLATDLGEPQYIFETREIVKATRRKRADFDLEAACMAARARVQRAINESAAFHSEQITESAKVQRWIINGRWRFNGMHPGQSTTAFSNAKNIGGLLV